METGECRGVKKTDRQTGDRVSQGVWGSGGRWRRRLGPLRLPARRTSDALSRGSAETGIQVRWAGLERLPGPSCCAIAGWGRRGSSLSVPSYRGPRPLDGAPPSPADHLLRPPASATPSGHRHPGHIFTASGSFPLCIRTSARSFAPPRGPRTSLARFSRLANPFLIDRRFNTLVI